LVHNRQQPLLQQASKNFVERLTWSTASRDQAGIAKGLAEGRDITEIYGLGEATLFDEFLCFLDKIGVAAHFPTLDPRRTQRASNVRFHPTLLIYLMRVTAGLRFFSHIDPVLLHCPSLMRLVGFNAREVREGTTARGRNRKPSAAQDGEDKAEPTDPSLDRVRGPYCPESIAEEISQITPEALERFFNQTIRILAAQGFYPKKVHALLDATDIESTERCEGCGKVTKEKAPEVRARKGRVRKLQVTVFGFKAWIVWDPNSRLPLALRFRTIEVPDIEMAQEVVAQAIENLGNHAKLASLAIDRGFLDGSFLWWVDRQQITFYIPAKTNLGVYPDALALASTQAPVVRSHQRWEGHGKNRTPVTDRWELVGLTGLTSAGFYGELGSGSHENRKDFVPNPLNAVVVLDDPYKQNNPDTDTLVLLTNGPVQTRSAALGAYDGYDARSEIENGLNREAKQAWFIERPAQNTLGGFRSHVYLTFLVMGLTTAFRAWLEAEDKSVAGLPRRAQPMTGIRKFREMVRQESANCLIVFEGERYAIFEAYEIAILLGRRVRMPRGFPETITQEDLLRKHGVLRQ
jgi:hypothetical protein